MEVRDLQKMPPQEARGCEVIEIDESNFCYWPNEQHTWLHTFEANNDWQNIGFVLEQLYAQMIGWC